MAEERLLTIENLDKVLAALGPSLVAGPVRDMFTSAVQRLEEDAKRGAPHDTGRLVTSITHKVDTAELPQWAVAGTNLGYAPFMEYGTGLFAEGDPAEKSGEGRHWPPGDALAGWAGRHGFYGGGISKAEGGFMVAFLIGIRGGLEPRRYMRRAWENNQGYIDSLVSKCGEAIGRIWEAAGE